VPGISTRTALVLLAALVLLSNLNVLDNEFLIWDDALLITSNARVQPPTFAAIARVFDPTDALAGRTLEFIPLRDLLYALLFRFVGLQAWAFHALSIAVHIGVCMLVFACGSRWVGERAGLLAAALFAAHPVHVESVAWAAALKDPTFTAAILGSLLFYTRYLREGRKRAYAAALALMVVALGFKQIAIVMPGLIALVGWTFGEKKPLQAIKHAIPFGLITMMVMPLYVIIGSRNHVLVDPPGGTRFTGIMTMAMVYADYVGIFVAPFALSPRYVVPPVMALSDLRLVASVALIGALFAVALAVRRRSRIPLFGLLWWTVALLPVMNIIPIPIEMADRYLYLPSVGVAIAAGAGLTRLLGDPRPALAYGAAAVAAVLISGWTALTIVQNDIWQDDVTLWTRVLADAPSFYPGRTDLAAAYVRRGDIAKAKSELEAALSYRPEHATAWLNLGRIYQDEKNLPKALEAYQQALTHRPDYPVALNNIGAVQMQLEQWAEARVSLTRAITLDAEYPTALRNLTAVCMKLGDTACALSSMRRAIDARPADRKLFLDWLKLLRITNQVEDKAVARARIDQHFAGDAEIQRAYAELP